MTISVTNGMSVECVVAGDGDIHDEWDSKTCKACGNVACADHFEICDDCDLPVCDNCRKIVSKQCDGCMEEICLEHIGKCPRCGDQLCNNRCLTEECEKCGKSFCDDCVNEINQDTVCKTCVPYD